MECYLCPNYSILGVKFIYKRWYKKKNITGDSNKPAVVKIAGVHHRLPVEETKKVQEVFRKYIRKYFYEIWEIQKLSSSFLGVFSGEIPRSVNRIHNRIFFEYSLTIFQTALLIRLIPNFIKIAPTVVSLIDLVISYRLRECEYINEQEQEVNLSNVLIFTLKC